MNRLTVLFIIALGVCVAPSYSFGQQQIINTSKIDSLLDKLSGKNKFMGSVAIRKHDQILYSRAYGLSDVQSRSKATPETKYRIGSISKMFTATMIFQLIEEHKLSLETKLSTYFSGIPNAEKITISDLLSHRSGIFNITQDSTYSEWHTAKQTQIAMLNRIKAYPADFEPNTKTEYSNSNFILLGYILETITGKSFADNLKTRIADRIGLKNTYYGSKTQPAKNESYSYSLDDGRWTQEPETDMSVPGGAGAIVSTPNDLTHFITALFNRELISKTSLDSMTTIREGLGRGIFVIPFGTHSGFGHNGGIDKFASGLSYFPDDSLSFAVCTNGLDYNLNAVAIGVLQICYNMPYEIPSLEEFAVDPKILKSYEGIYSSNGVPLKIKITIKNHKLTAQASGQPSFPLDAVSNTEFRFNEAGIKISFKKEHELLIEQGGQETIFIKE